MQAWCFLAALLLSGIPPAHAAGPEASGAVVLQGGETPEQIQAAYTQAITALAPQLGYGPNSQQALRKYEATVHQAARPGAEAERIACGKAVAAALLSDVPVNAKLWLLKLVEFTGKAEIVPAVARLLEDPDPVLREGARGALQHNPAPEAATALQAAMARATDPAWQAALVLALGTRQDAASVPALARRLLQKDEVVVQAALFALGNIANADATRALAGAQKTVPEKLRGAAAESYMKCAEQLLKEGKAARAGDIYREIYNPAQPRPVRLAALRGMLTSAGDRAGSMILEALGGDDVDGQVIALGFIPDLSGNGLRTLADGLGKLPSGTQTLLLGMLAERGEKSALPAALRFARSTNELIQLAGLTALGRLGDAGSVVVLLEALGAGGSAAGTAKESLTRLNAEGVNDRLLAAARQETDPGRRASLAEVLEARGAPAFVPFFLQEAVSDNAGLRRVAMRALGRLAQPQDLAAMAKGLMKAAPGGEREDAAKAMVTVCARKPEPARQAEPVLELYRAAGPSERLALLPVLGRLGGANALEVLKTALASTDPATYEAGVAAISNWPDSDEAVEGELVTLAQKAEKPADRAAAVRAYIRVISLPSGLADLEKLKKFQKAMDLAERDEERKLVLERVGDIRRRETLRFVMSQLDKPALTQRAATTVVEMSRDRGFRDRNKADFEQALQQVVAVCTDSNVVERAKRRLQEQ
jgi:HEAT repeat protein